MSKNEVRECYSFTLVSKSVALVAFCWAGYLLHQTTSLLTSLAWSNISLLVLLFACLAWSLVYMVIAKTHVDDQCISESGLLSKQVKISDIEKVKVIDIPGLRWLIIPRAVVQVRGFGSYTFRTSNHEVLMHFNRVLLKAISSSAQSKPLGE